jgi:exopolyphosphatase / guanosine-5'-triphosphate,3'-diphosphate pyrophosphatase
MRPNERVAVIDLGSGSFRLVVFTVGDGWWKRTDEIYQHVRIGEGLEQTGVLGVAPIERALDTLDVFAHFCRATGLQGDAVDAVATSAIREADNAQDFLARARARSGLPIRVLSREQEARYGYIAAVDSTTLRDGCVLDLGGGSLQLVRVCDRVARASGSWRLGTVRMTERLLPGKGPTKRGRMSALREHVVEQLQGVDWLARGGRARGERRLVAIGGTVRNLAAAAQRATGQPSMGVQGVVIEPAGLERLVVRLASLPVAERSTVPGIKPARADVILAGAIVLQEVQRIGGFAGVEVTEAGLREGVFFERLLADRDPPLFEDVRRGSVLNLAGRYELDAAHTHHVAALALGLFDELARLGVHAGDPRERELLWAASMLHDIGMSVDYDDHHKHSRYLILNAGLPGFSPGEVAIIAQAARYHRKGMPEAGPLRALIAARDMRRLDRCAVLLRLAEDLERSRDQLVRGTSVQLGDGEVRLRLLADEEPAVARWAARRERELFARAFDRELSVAA